MTKRLASSALKKAVLAALEDETARVLDDKRVLLPDNEVLEMLERLKAKARGVSQ